MKRWVIVAFGVVGLLPAAPGVASAKIPPYTVEISPAAPVAGEPIRITVRFWRDAQHTARSRFPDGPWFRDFLWAVEVDRGSPPIPIDIRPVRPGVHRGELAVPAAGRWELCAGSSDCDTQVAAPGYPDRIPFEVAVAISPGDPRSPDVLYPVGVADVEGRPGRFGDVPRWLALVGLLALAVAASTGVIRSALPGGREVPRSPLAR